MNPIQIIKKKNLITNFPKLTKTKQNCIFVIAPGRILSDKKKSPFIKPAIKIVHTVGT